jgi:TRAP-type C4-dicarboxylate transport system permease small subunit
VSTALRRGWDAAIAAIRHVLHLFIVALFGSYCVIILMQVFFRYVLNSSLIWSEETVRFEQFWVTMLAVALCADRRAHIRLEGLEHMFPPGIRPAVEKAADIVTIIACVFLFRFGVQFVMESIPTKSSAMQVSMDWAYTAMPVGAVLTILFTVDFWLRRKPAARR